MKEVNYNNLPQAIEDLNDKLIDIKNLLIVQGRDPQINLIFNLQFQNLPIIFI